MTSRISQNGQIVIPKAIRDQVRLHPGDEVEFGVQDEQIFIRARRPSADFGGRFANSGMAARLRADRSLEPR